MGELSAPGTFSASATAKGLRPGLYAITDSQLLTATTLLAAVEAALRGGAVMVQYREKSAPQPERLAQARDLAALCNDARVPLIINDDPVLARRCGAAGVHLGQTDSSLADARQQLGEHAIIGATCHADLALARRADRDGADYLAFGRFFTSGTKPDAPPADTAVLARARHFGKPVTAIGGITPDNGEALIRAGADMLAVVGGLFKGDPASIEARARQFARLFATHHPLFSSSVHQES
ncbi:thiamine phosphate synthase [Marinobacter orientalis]|uniref:Thiamine-phosphate synthase n=1 Tax=Marinobacter orientalis TaxID=1928859 RepID=A0A7Y0WRW8_9GAMM|nr:thiamine phosphate synthase [Marinobacter orientalis]NMT63340.1 thiamine phosphate synthase [Marinobacter orientalis]TGX51983.1 thiamine phosphate synthase [Marinobacter orientalis]